MNTFRIDFRRDIVTTFPSFQFTRDSASLSNDGNFLEQAFIDFESNAGQYKIGPGTMRLQFDIFSYNYFNTNSLGDNYGHIFAIARYNKESVLEDQKINGQGVVIGNVSNFRNLAKNSKGNSAIPSIQAKTWADIVNDNCISNTSFNGTLRDNIQYRVVFDSIVSNTLTNKVRYRLYKVLTPDRLELIYDSKQVEVGQFDFNPSQFGVAFGHVNGNKTGDVWRLEFTNIKTIWGPHLTTDVLPDDTCTCPRAVTAYSSKNELFEFDSADFRIGFDYDVIESTPDGTPIYGFKDYATKTDKGYRIQHLGTPYTRLPAFLNLGIKFKPPEEVLFRPLRPNIQEYKGYDTWSVGVKGTVEILHDCIEFAGHGKILPIETIITDSFLNFGKTFFPKNVSGNTAQLVTTTFVPFNYISPNTENQRTNRKNIYFVFNLSEVVYYLNSGAVRQESFNVATGVEITVSIPIDIGQDTCCGDNINNLPQPLPSSIIPVPFSSRLTFYLNYNTGIKQTSTWIGGNGKVTASISPKLPSGLEFNKENAEISGTPLTLYPPTVHTITFNDNKNETASFNIFINVDSGAPT